MSDTLPKLSDVIEVRPCAQPPPSGQALLLGKGATLEIRLLTLTRGREIPTHPARGEISVHCLQGRIAFTGAGITRELNPAQLIILAAGEPHSLVGLEDSTVLVTKVLPANT